MNISLLKKIIIIILFLTANRVSGQYSGTYTVGGSSPTFNTLTAAFNALKTSGISGNVRLNVRSGTYTERISIGGISGTSNSAIIKIAPDPNNNSPVIIKNSLTSLSTNFIFEATQGYFEFDSIQFKVESNSRYGRIFDFNGNLKNVTFDGCTFYGRDTSSEHDYFAILYDGFNDSIDNYKILNCNFHFGSFAIYHFGHNSRYEKGFDVINSNFYNYYYHSIYTYYQKSPSIQGNYSIDKNKDVTANGMRFYDCDSLKLTNNRIYLSRGETALYIERCDGSAQKPVIISNNIICVYDSSKSDATSISLKIVNGAYVSICFNTIYNCNKDNSSIAFHFYGTSGTIVNNNNIIKRKSGYAIKFINSSNNNCDYNNYYSEGSYIGNYSTSYFKDLSAIKSFTGLDKNSISNNMLFRSYTDLRTNSKDLDSAGTPISGISTDIDGQTRDAAFPDIGADEYGVLPPLNGTYTIGGSTPDFPNIDSAFNYAEYYGISGNVRFNVRSGTYVGQTTIDYIEGTSNSNRIKIAPDPQNTSPVVFKFKITTLPYNYIFNVKQGFVEFDSVTFVVDSASVYGKVFDFTGDCENVTFDNCIFYGKITTNFNAAPYYAILYDHSPVVNNYKVQNCTFYNGEYGIYHISGATIEEKDAEFKNNKFINFNGVGIYLAYSKSPVIQGNYFTDNKIYGCWKSIYLRYVDSYVVKENKLNINWALSVGVDMENCNGSATNPNIFANNFITLSDKIASSTIFNLSGGKYTYVTYNTFVVNSSSGLTNSNCIRLDQKDTSQKSVFKNNNIVNFGLGYAHNITSTMGFIEMDYNNYYSRGKSLGYFKGIALKNLAEIKDSTGMEKNSVSSHVKFKDIDSYINDTYALDSNASVISYISTDIDGKPRDKKKPDIGAYEFSLPDNDLGVLKIITSDQPGCGSDSVIASIVIKNIARFPQSNFKVCLTVKDSLKTIFLDTFIYKNTLKSQQIDTIRFKKINTKTGGIYEFIGAVILASDTFPFNDTINLTINLTPAVGLPDMQSDTICDNKSYMLTTNYPPNTFLRWYNSKTGGKIVSNNNTFIINNLKKDTTFYTVAVRPGTSLDSINATQTLSLNLTCNGMMFDIVPKISLSVDSFASFFKSGYSHTVLIFFKKGTFKGSEKIKSNWQAIDTVNLTIGTTNSLANIPLKKSIALQKDSVYGFYISYSQIGYASSTIAQDSNIDIRIKKGSSICGLFSDPYADRAFVGKVFYRKYSECESSRVPYTLKVNKKPALYLGKDTAFCENSGITLNLDGGANNTHYNWSTGDSSRSIIVKKEGKYGVTVTDINNCSNFDTIGIKKLSNPFVHLGNDTIYCKDKGISYTLNPGIGYKTYLWNTGANTSSIQVNSNGLYTVKVTNTNNCDAADTVLVSNYPEHPIRLGNDTAYCSNGENVKTLDAGLGFLTYNWSGGEKTRTLDVKNSGYYSVIANDSNNCIATGKIFIAVNENPKIDLGKDVSYCIDKGINIVLDAGFGFKTYKWSTLDSTQKININSAGNYSVTVADGNNCQDSDTLIVKGNQSPKVDLGPDREHNQGTAISDTLDAGSGFKTYKWNTSAATQKIVVNDEGTYFVKVTDTNGCEGTDTILIKYKKTEGINYTSKNFKVFPNPAESMLNIVSNAAIIETIKVYDLEGRIVSEKFDKSNESQIDITSLLDGLYFAVILTNKGSEAIKFMVKH